MGGGVAGVISSLRGSTARKKPAVGASAAVPRALCAVWPAAVSRRGARNRGAGPCDRASLR
eukprot:9304663-Pyramimonas_sp.AAC.1